MYDGIYTTAGTDDPPEAPNAAAWGPCGQPNLQWTRAAKNADKSAKKKSDKKDAAGRIFAGHRGVMGDQTLGLQQLKQI